VPKTVSLRNGGEKNIPHVSYPSRKKRRHSLQGVKRRMIQKGVHLNSKSFRSAKRSRRPRGESIMPSMHGGNKDKSQALRIHRGVKSTIRRAEERCGWQLDTEQHDSNPAAEESNVKKQRSRGARLHVWTLKVRKSTSHVVRDVTLHQRGYACVQGEPSDNLTLTP